MTADDLPQNYVIASHIKNKLHYKLVHVDAEYAMWDDDMTIDQIRYYAKHTCKLPLYVRLGNGNYMEENYDRHQTSCLS